MLREYTDLQLEKLLLTHGSLLKKIAYDTLNDPDEVEDILQMVFLKILSNYPERLLLPQDELKNYLCKAVHNTALNFRYRKAFCCEDIYDPLDAKDSWVFHQECHLIYDLMSPMLDFFSIIEHLASDEQEILYLHYYHQYSYREIALLLGGDYEQVRKRASRAVRKLRAEYIEKIQ